MTTACWTCGVFHADGLCPSDPVKRPVHYTLNLVRQPGEVIDVLEAWDLPWHLANVVQYIARHRLKNGAQDLYKARWYLDRYLKLLETGARKVEMQITQTLFCNYPLLTGPCNLLPAHAGEHRSAREIREIHNPPKLEEEKENTLCRCGHWHDRHCAKVTGGNTVGCELCGCSRFVSK